MIQSAQKEWDSLAEKTNFFELKQLRERKTKMEGKILSSSYIIDPVNKLLPVQPKAEKAPPAGNPQGRNQDFGGRGRGRYRGRLDEDTTPDPIPSPVQNSNPND